MWAQVYKCCCCASKFMDGCLYAKTGLKALCVHTIGLTASSRLTAFSNE
jgi:hypothetical protein